jgi:D-lactate dehydrogenase
MKVAVFSAKSYDKKYLDQENKYFKHKLEYIELHLDQHTAPLAKGFDAVCAFVNDNIDEHCLHKLSSNGVKIIALRCAGFNNINLRVASALDMTVVRVPEYSPHGVAEHALTLILSLNRKIYRAYNRVRENNFSLEGLLGFNLHSKTIGVIGTGKIGSVFCSIMLGLGCKVLACDPYPNELCIAHGVEYVDIDCLFTASDIISLHCPLTPETNHIINDHAISCMKDGVMLINTSRGALIDTVAIIKGLKSEKIGYLGLDVYEEEGDLFFEDVSEKILEDDVFARLLTFPNVLITGHQAFFTSEALASIANTTLQNLSDIEAGKHCQNRVTEELVNPGGK